MAARAQQHGGVRFCRAPRQQPKQNSTAGLGFAFTGRAAWAPGHPRCAAQRPLGILGPFWACLAAPRAAWLAPPHERRCNSALAGSSAERIFFKLFFH